MMYSACKLNKQGDTIQPWHTPFAIWNQSVAPCTVLTVASWHAYRFLKRQVRWSGMSIFFRFFHSLLWSTQSKALSSQDTIIGKPQYDFYPHLCMCAHSVVSDSLQPPILSPTGSCVHGIFQARILEQVAISYSPGDLPDPGIEPMSPASSALTGGFFTTVPPGKPFLPSLILPNSYK